MSRWTEQDAADVARLPAALRGVVCEAYIVASGEHPDPVIMVADLLNWLDEAGLQKLVRELVDAAADVNLISPSQFGDGGNDVIDRLVEIADRARLVLQQ